MQHVDSYLGAMIRALEQLPREPLTAIAGALWETYTRDGTIFTCGNGGSAATASHFTCDLAKWTARPHRRRVRAIALTDNVPLIMAYANDLSYADVFVEQLMNLYRPGDLLIAISGSGNSPNVLRAVAWANRAGAPTVGLTGFDGGELARLAQHVLRVDTYCMPQVEDMHSTVCHALAISLGHQIDAALLEAEVILPAAQLGLREHVIG